jgi:inorganic pyrophosphatase
VSEPEYFESFVDRERIDEVIDHHPGLEDYWQERIGDGATIEHVGAACTQVYEKWEQAGIADQISERSAALLMCGILDNTLNFGAAITNQRDRHAYQQLERRANLPHDWPAIYFEACGQSILSDLPRAIANDLKVLVTIKVTNKSYIITDNTEVQKWFNATLGVQFNNTIAAADRTWLRKEIMKADIDKHAAI